MMLATLVAVLAAQQVALVRGAPVDVQMPASSAPRRVVLEHTTECAGTVYVWIEASGAPVQYRVTWADQGWGRHEGAGAAVTFSFMRELPANTRFEVTLAPLGDAPAIARVHYDIAEETDATRAAVAAGNEALRVARELGSGGEALDVLAAWMWSLPAYEGADRSRRVNDVLWAVSETPAFQRWPEFQRDVWERVLAFGARFLPEAHSDRQVAAESRATALTQLGRASEARAELERVVALYLAVQDQRPLEIELARARYRLARACAADGAEAEELEQLTLAEDAAAAAGAIARDLRRELRRQLAQRHAAADALELAECFDSAPADESHCEPAVFERVRAALLSPPQGVEQSCAALTGCLRELESLPEPTRDRVVDAAAELAVALWRAGCAEALDALAKVVALRSAATSPSSFDTLVARTEHALALAGSDDPTRLMRGVVADLERTVAEHDPQLLFAIDQLGVLHDNRGEFAEAAACFERCVELRAEREPRTSSALLAARRRLWHPYRKLARFDRAWELAEEDLAALEAVKPRDDAVVQELRARAADLAFNCGRIARCVELCEQVVAVLERTKPESDELQAARGELAVTLMSDGKAVRALALRRQVHAQLVARHGARDPRSLVALTDLGAALLAAGELTASVASTRSALEQLEELIPGEDVRVCAARFWHALCLEALGDYTEARALFERCLASAGKLDDPSFDFTLVEANFGRLLYALGDKDAARTIFERVEARYAATLHADHRFIHVARGSLAKLAFERGDVAGARALHERVLVDLRRTRDDSDEVVVNELDNYSVTLRACGELALARTIGESVVARVADMPWRSDYYGLRAIRNLGWTLACLGDTGALAPLTAQLREGIDLAGLRARGGSLRELQELSAASEDDISSYLSLVAHLGESEAEARLAFAAIERFRDIRSASPAWRAASGDAESRAKLERLRELRSALAGMVLTSRPEEREDRQRIVTLVRERDAIERELVEQARANGDAAASLDVASVASALSEGACAVAFKQYERTVVDPAATGRTLTTSDLLAHVVTRDGRLVRLELGALAPIEAAVASWRSAVGAPLAGAAANVADASSAGKELRRRVLDPVFAASDGARTLHVCLDGPLHLVPLDALQLDDGSFVGETRRVLVEVSLARLTDDAPREKREPSFLALGGADFDASTAQASAVIEASAPVLATSRGGLETRWRPLPHTLEEVRALGALFSTAFARDATILCDREATKSALNARAPNATFVHVATHGYFAPPEIRARTDRGQRGSWSPMDFEATVTGFAPLALCGLVLAGANGGADELGRVPGVMTAEELAALDLSGCELAVLAACETNLGLQRAGQSVQSLQAALRIAGARAAITSSWVVDDQAARELMLDFYERVWVKREPKAAALWAAKMKLHAARRPPLDWAGWVLTGDPR